MLVTASSSLVPSRSSPTSRITGSFVVRASSAVRSCSIGVVPSIKRAAAPAMRSRRIECDRLAARPPRSACGACRHRRPSRARTRDVPTARSNSVSIPASRIAVRARPTEQIRAVRAGDTRPAAEPERRSERDRDPRRGCGGQRGQLGRRAAIGGQIRRQTRDRHPDTPEANDDGRLHTRSITQSDSRRESAGDNWRFGC